MGMIIKQLQEDHKQLVRVLYHLEREVKAYAGLIKAEGGLEAILDILDYIQIYPEIWHHPTEDIIYQRLMEKGVEGAKEAADSMEEHGVLEVLTEKLHTLINELAAGRSDCTGHSKLCLVKTCSDYLQCQLSHMEHEQQLLFPLIEQHLVAEDWEKIKQSIKNQASPLNNHARLQEYQLRYQAIANASAVTAH